MQKVSIIVPCYNEEKIIRSTYKKIKEELEKITDNYEIIFANDGSTDNTKKILENIVSKGNKTRLISWQKNKGLGYALRCLYKTVKKDSIIQMAADLSIQPIIFNKFLRNIKTYDVVIASRYKGIKGKIPFCRKLSSRVYYLLCKSLFRTKIKDISSGFMAFRKSVLENLNLKSDGFEIHIELMCKLKQKGYNIKEIPAHYSHRGKGSKFNMLIDGSLTCYRTVLFWIKKKIIN